ncbi:hypothetical protein ACTXT7_010490 [Hymenolepis weldensis]
MIGYFVSSFAFAAANGGPSTAWYVGDPNFLLKLAEIARDIKSTNPHSRFYCDPVIGDNGKIYVPEELIPIYKEKILTVADVLMPNQFEAELLTGCKITDEHSALNCIDILHSTYQIPTIILTSTELPFVDEQGNPLLATYMSHQPKLVEERKCKQFDDDCAQKAQRVRALFPKLNVTFFGTGDLFSSLTLIYFEKQNGQFDMAIPVIEVRSCVEDEQLRDTFHLPKSNVNTSNGLGMTWQPIGTCTNLVKVIVAEPPRINSILKITFIKQSDGWLSTMLYVIWLRLGDGEKVLYKIQCTIQAILRRTLEYAKRFESDPTNTMEKVDRFELRLIQSAGDILNPPELPSVQRDRLTLMSVA